MRRDQPERRTDAPRLAQSTRPDRRVPVCALVARCAVLCALLLAIAYGVAAIGDAFEQRVSLVAATAGFDAFTNAPDARSGALSLATKGEPLDSAADIATAR
jgi:hypothetical protein